MRIAPLFVAGALALLAAQPAFAQANTKLPDPVEGALPVTVEEITVHSPAIEGNLMGESAERQVMVILPPSYASEPDRHYPVVYALHGYGITAKQWMVEIHAPQTVEGAFAKGAKDMIVVLPTSKNIYNGSMYSSSRTTGNFELYVAEDVVAYIDANYRTIPARESRGLVGHSMGGYGAQRIGMKHPDVFGALYLMSIGGGSAKGPAPLSAEDLAAIDALKNPEEAVDLPFFALAELAKASAWSPNPNNPPLYADMPYRDGEYNADVVAKWNANRPMPMVDQYIDNLSRYKAIQIDVGDADGALPGAEAFSDVLSSYGVEHDFLVFAGDHTSELGYRFQDFVLPFFSENLTFD